MSFAIASHGRSGTKFLASLLDRSPSWTVQHEPGGDSGFLPLTEVQARFDSGGPRYGEVNSTLRVHLGDLRVDRRFVILRDPLAVFLSAANRKPAAIRSGAIEPILAYHDEQFRIVHRLVRSMIPAIRFELMTTNLVYLADQIEKLGVDDVEPTPADLARKVNANRKTTWPTLDDLPRGVGDLARERFAWYRRKYYGEERTT